MYWIITVLGVLLLIAPFVLGFAADTATLSTCMILGLVVALPASTKAVTEDEGRWEIVVPGIAGVLAVLAPFVLGFGRQPTATWSSIALGVLVVALAGRGYFVCRLTGQAVRAPEQQSEKGR